MTLLERVLVEDLPPLRLGHRWRVICPVAGVIPGRGVAARVAGTLVAVFVLTDGEVLAVDNHDPCSGADVLSRGLVGDVLGEPAVASPVYKQRFLLRTGQCVEDDSISIRTWSARVRQGWIEVAVP